MEYQQKEVEFISDIMMRIFANRNTNTVMNSMFTCINSIAHSIPKSGSERIAEMLRRLASDIEAIGHDVKAE